MHNDAKINFELGNALYIFGGDNYDSHQRIN